MCFTELDSYVCEDRCCLPFPDMIVKCMRACTCFDVGLSRPLSDRPPTLASLVQYMDHLTPKNIPPAIPLCCCPDKGRISHLTNAQKAKL